MIPTYVELFAGAGGLSMGLESAGFRPIAHAEIEPHARAVLRKHWPDVRLDGDVTLIDGRDFAGATLISGGSPCQDLSVAGKRAGLAGARSSLFYEQCRIWEESGAPYLLWENVYGALSSNAGRDFAAVLSRLVGAAVTVPADGWRVGGVAAGPAGVAAWRVSDLQHFGPPQRRNRVFILVTRAGGVDPAAVLALTESVCRHPSPREQARKDVAGRAVEGSQGGSVGANHTSVFAWDSELNPSDDTHGPLVARTKSGGDRNGVVALSSFEPFVMASGQANADIGRGISPTLTLLHEAPITVVGTLDAKEGEKWGSNQWVDRNKAMIVSGRPRRLTPRECERLMSWPDDHTRYGVKDDGTAYELSDTPRYRLCGNGVASVQVAWIARRLADAIARQNVRTHF